MANKSNLALNYLINAKDNTSGVFNKLKNNAGKVASAIAGYFGVKFFKSAIDEAEALQTQTGALEAIIKSTGGAAGLTADEIVAMSKRLDEATLGSAEGFRNASASLLTFKSVGKDSFETTLSLAQDLATAGFGTLESNTRQLGKALEDPVDGLTALKRSGVSFTESEKELIKSLVETGEKAKAQKIILKALTDQVGGAGSGAGGGLAGAVDLAGKRFTDFKVQLGTGMLSPLTRANTLVAEFLGRLNNSGDVTAFGEKIGHALVSVIDLTQSTVTWFSELYTQLKEEGAIAAFSERFSVALEAVKGLISTVSEQFLRLYRIFDDTSSTTTFAGALSTVLIKLIDSVVLLVNSFSTGLTTIETAFHTLSGVGSAFFGVIMDGIARIESGMAKVTFGDVSRRWSQEAEKSRAIAESFAASAETSFKKADDALIATADNAAKTRQSFDQLTTATEKTTQAIDETTQSSNWAAEMNVKLSDSIKIVGAESEVTGNKAKSAADKVKQASKEEAEAVIAVEKAFKDLGITAESTGNKQVKAAETPKRSIEQLRQALRDAKKYYQDLSNSGTASTGQLTIAWNDVVGKTNDVINGLGGVDNANNYVAESAKVAGSAMEGAYQAAENQVRQTEGAVNDLVEAQRQQVALNFDRTVQKERAHAKARREINPTTSEDRRRVEIAQSDAEAEKLKRGISATEFNTVQKEKISQLSAENKDLFNQQLNKAIFESVAGRDGKVGRVAELVSANGQNSISNQADKILARLLKDQLRQSVREQQQQQASETIAVQLNVGGQRQTGIFPKDQSTNDLLEALRRSGAVS